jgi:TetR/AcrR family transcriptional regulator, cholesterol catabolism regulator
MEDRSESSLADLVIGVVVGLLESEGYDGVRLREVARRSHLSLRTIYELFGSRDELIVTALERWMATNTYGDLAPAGADETVYDGIMRTLRYVFEPWERNPHMLRAYYQARNGPVGRRLDEQGFRKVGPVGMAMIAGADPTYAADVGLIIQNMVYAVVGRFAGGELDVTEILPTLERAVYRITADNRAEAAEAVDRRAQALADQADPRRTHPRRRER